MQADEVPRLRAERRGFKPDPRFDAVVKLLRSGAFGWEDYFAPILDSITTGGCMLTQHTHTHTHTTSHLS